MPRLWTAFVVAWLPVFGIVIWWLVRTPLAPLRLAAVVLALAALVGLYLGLTLHWSLADVEPAPAGPDRPWSAAG